MSVTSPDSRFMLVSTIVGRPVGFSAVAGEVVAVERWTETRVGSAGGSVHVHGNNVAVVPPKVWTTATARKALWIRTADDEIQVPVPDGMQVRQGHRVHAVIATGVNRGGSQWAAVANHDTNRWMQVGRFPPTGAYNPWTSFVVGFGQGLGDLTVGIMGLYGFSLGILFLFSTGTGASFLTGFSSAWAWASCTRCSGCGSPARPRSNTRKRSRQPATKCSPPPGRA